MIYSAEMTLLACIDRLYDKLLLLSLVSLLAQITLLSMIPFREGRTFPFPGERRAVMYAIPHFFIESVNLKTHSC